MRKPFVEKLANFLVGASWALTIVGAIVSFRLFSSYGFFSGILGLLLGSLLGLFFVVLFEYIIYKVQLGNRQTELLEKLLEDKDSR